MDVDPGLKRIKRVPHSHRLRHREHCLRSDDRVDENDMDSKMQGKCVPLGRHRLLSICQRNLPLNPRLTHPTTQLVEILAFSKTQLEGEDGRVKSLRWLSNSSIS